MAYTSYFEALEECQLSSLEYRRLYNDLVYTYKIIVSKEIIMEVPIFEIFNHAGSLRRHKYYLKSLIKNQQKYLLNFSLIDFTNCISCSKEVEEINQQRNFACSPN
ncbi:Protein CBG08501 [Caenorhabditis briggsae]|uniref:Protein CBG08501 n=1 Tax=Caenorhabditis briggsae TaxID=6238 RepID=A8X6Q3_CAEBR|nr:Protein CBG08501 [Caenorhabditis briggsae]CAP28314.1 Protein CBG08501 [Caenorhabditis briggsae]